MELRQCRYFIAVIDARSISEAARRLHVVQSAVSHQVGKLEVELGTPLLRRSRDGVLPTAAGRLLYVHAQAMLKHVQAARESIRALDDEVRGTVALGLPGSTADVLVVPLLKELRAKLPYVVVRVVEGLGNVLVEDLATGRLDLSILFEVEPPRGFRREPLLKERLHFVTTDQEVRVALAGANSVEFSSVARYPLILPPAINSVRVLLDREAARRKLRLSVVAEMSGVKTMLDAVEAGLGSSVMMAANALPLLRRQETLVLPIRAPRIERVAALFQSDLYPLTPATHAARTVLQDVVRTLIAQRRWPGARLA